MESIVALDIETTGLDAERDAILEIGLVRFTGRRVEEEWSTLINPGRRIPPGITQLTGITDQMVLGAPTLQAVLPKVVQFTGRSPILGHNIRFDLSFLQRNRILMINEALDTYELASVLMPNAGRYKLGSLCQALGVPLAATHRALDDAQATRGVFLRLIEMANELPLPLLAEIVKLGERIEWAGNWLFQQALRSRSREVVSARAVHHSNLGPLFRSLDSQFAEPLQPNDKPSPLDVDDVASILEQGGIFSKYFPNYEFRSQQVEMLRAVTKAFSEGKHLMVEAGTGTGKSMAYLIPAALWALHNRCRVVISTNTINLQDQLINKDIPDLCNALGLDLRATVLKGRTNYLCPRRFENFRKRGPQTADEMRILAKVLVWLQGTTSGDRSELNLNGPVERQVWARLSAEDEGCTNENCMKMGGSCPFFRMHQAAISSHILIVNHALLLADVATGNRVLPEYDYLIIDEAHHIEDATTNALSFHGNQFDIERVLRELGGVKNGLLAWVVSATEHLLTPSDAASLNQLIQHATDTTFRLDNEIRQFFIVMEHFLDEQREGRPLGLYAHQERILPATRALPHWGDVEVSWDENQRIFSALLEDLNKIIQFLGEINPRLEDEDLELPASISNIYRRMVEFHDNLNSLVFDPEVDRVYWIEAHPTGQQISIHAAPLHIGPLMERYLWREKSSVILTSATLTTAGEFDYLRGRLNAQDAYELALGSPFDYENSAMIYIANDIPEPNDRTGHQRAVEQGLLNLCRATGGKTLVLFTSYEQLKRTSQAISPHLNRSDILVYEQGEGASAHSLLENFRNTDRAVLLGTRAFWEGVDVPGEALSVLVIVKLPFDVPSDPIISARAETFDDSFSQYSLPEAILRFRQGFGRLIRSRSDHGVVVILDRRIQTKRYGQMFMDSLPTCTVRSSSLANLPKIAAQWLNL